MVTYTPQATISLATLELYSHVYLRPKIPGFLKASQLDVVASAVLSLSQGASRGACQRVGVTRRRTHEGNERGLFAREDTLPAGGEEPALKNAEAGSGRR